MLNFLAPYKLYAYAGLVILIALMLGLHLHGDNALRKERDELKDYKIAQILLADAAILENARKLAQASLKVTQAVKASDELLAKFNLANVDRNQLTKKVSVLNASINQNEIIAARTRANLSDVVRLSASRDGLAASQESSAAERLSTTDSNAATFRQACRLTTIDLVKAYAIIEADTIACGREQ